MYSGYIITSNRLKVDRERIATFLVRDDKREKMGGYILKKNKFRKIEAKHVIQETTKCTKSNLISYKQL